MGGEIFSKYDCERKKLNQFIFIVTKSLEETNLFYKHFNAYFSTSVSHMIGFTFSETKDLTINC